ncbi:hypothetical protein BAUCODRAFT_119666 [Baudoinia panamericana UAMH 10762]|uniref:MARVEL domain-containing protein n=1 Tax=Baudoinia panamericana (strain UAMH 10762) TaxID=717646 RepID=M2N7N6_BAUPA|nr:uncharacterized protein BAUCODRAFT_119666 [Baudoinia panamericana UAMH 10762]EMD00114.1 hypothetical protein BAUCODRAFT_119666 [Baudoinia panamericana UAMH 10762]
MARSSVSRTRVVVRQSYYWPDQQLNFWIIIMLATGGVLIGVFAAFLQDQQRFGLKIPWLFPYGITVGSLTVIFVWIMLALIYQRRLLPGVVIIGSFILLVLYITGVIETAIQLFRNTNGINGQCNSLNANAPGTGLSLNMLAWLELNSICQSWQAAFAFWIVGAVFLLWMIVLGSQVARNGGGD